MTQPKPAHLTAENAARFQARSVVDLYHLRAPYPAAVFDTLIELMRDEPRVALDVGTGTGEIARVLARREGVERVDAVDLSQPMLERARARPGGDNPRIRWIQGAVEDAPLAPPYALITAGASLHWFVWETALPRFAQMLTPQGVLAILDRYEDAPPWSDQLRMLIARYSTIKNYEEFDLSAELERRALFTKQGAWRSAPEPFTQSVEDYIAAFHSTSSLTHDAMPPAELAAFDAGVRALVAPYARDGALTFDVTANVVWGRPRG